MKLILLFSFIITVNYINAQYGFGTNTPNTNSVAHFYSQDSAKGIIIPTVTTTNRPLASSSLNGMLIYNITDSCVQFCNGTKWVCLDSVGAASIGVDNDWDINANGSGLEGNPGNNIANGTNSITAGDGNTASGNYSVVFGHNNTASGLHSAVLGGEQNSSSNTLATVSGGARDTASAYASTVSGGFHNVASKFYATVSGGRDNVAKGGSSVVAGGFGNMANGDLSVVAGGDRDTAYSYGEWVGGLYSTIYTPSSVGSWVGTDRLFVVGNGTSTITRSNALTILKDGHLEINDAYTLPNVDGTTGQVLSTNGSGIVSWQNAAGGTDDQNIDSLRLNGTVLHTYIENGASANVDLQPIIDSAIANTTSIDNDWNINANGTGLEAAPAGDNYASGINAIAAGQSDTASGDYSVVSGGYYNKSLAQYATVSGGVANIASQYGGTIGGGLNNEAGNTATVSGGAANRANIDYATIGGGLENLIIGNTGTISGGSQNYVSGIHGTIGGGNKDTVYGNYSVVVGGEENTVGETHSFIGSGLQNKIVASQFSVINGGHKNTIFNGATSSAILGGQFNEIFNGASTSVIVGGLRNSIGGLAQNSLAWGMQAKANHNGSMVLKGGDTYILGDSLSSSNDYEISMQFEGGYRFFTDPSASTGVELTPGSGSWATISDRNKKENFKELSYKEILNKINEIPVTEWNYISQEDDVRHIGPMAQDFYKAFKLDNSDTTITTGDISGVNMAAIKGLIEQNKEQQKLIDVLTKRIEALEQK